MLNQQAPMGPDRNVETLLLHSVFLTIQGEGPFAGQPAVFVRLAGCNLQCPLCDTEYTEGARRVPVIDIIRAINEADPDGKAKVIVITGGEPLRQNILRLFLALMISSFPKVQVESNGKLLPDWDEAEKVTVLNMLSSEFLTVVVSPKTARIHQFWADHATAFKYVVKDGRLDPEDYLPTVALEHPTGKGGLWHPPLEDKRTIYLQPADEQDEALNELNIAETVRAVTHANGEATRVFGLQLHKYADLP